MQGSVYSGESTYSGTRSNPALSLVSGMTLDNLLKSALISSSVKWEQ